MNPLKSSAITEESKATLKKFLFVIKIGGLSTSTITTFIISADGLKANSSKLTVRINVQRQTAQVDKHLLHVLTEKCQL